jgi:hypothetical protein
MATRVDDEDVRMARRSGREFCGNQPEVTGGQLLAHVAGLAEQAGYEELLDLG